MFKIKTNGFTVAEVMICVAVVGLLSVFLIPKILYANNNHKYETLVKESFIQIGEAYLASKKDTRTVEEDLTSGLTENRRFYDYLYEHLNYRSVITNAASTTNSELCNTTRNYFILPVGTVVKRICTNTASPRYLRIGVCVSNSANNCPSPTNTTISYWVVVPEDPSNPGKTQDRYTTEFGAGINATCTDADRILNMGC